ncbi:MAG: hypothetical protein P4K83_10640 [Terracidiphilus sp.]|nr:hypothetical protein [Terracidiphilus sp.]
MNSIRCGEQIWKRLAGIALLVIALAACHAAAQETAKQKAWQLGSEVDVMPYATGGYYGSGFLGHDGWKARYVVARTNIPSFLVSDGYRDKRTDAYALLADRFIGAHRRQLEGLWVGGGAEYWRNRIRAENSPTYVPYQNYMATIGAGYVWKLSRHIYINPWAAGHLVVAHSREIPVAGQTYKQPIFTPEGSVKIGFTF